MENNNMGNKIKNILKLFIDKLNGKKFLYISIIIILIVIIGIGTFFGIKAFLEQKAKNQVEKINIILESSEINKQNCEIILDFDKYNISKNNKFFDEVKFDDFNKKCSFKFSIEYIELSIENCSNLIKEKKSFFEDRFIKLDQYENKINECSSKFLKVNFSTGTFFDPENDFKSSINIDFSLDFYNDVSDESSPDFINNRIEAKQRLIKLIQIKPNIVFGIDDLILYPNKAILHLPLEPETEYNFSLKSFDTDIGKQTEKQNFLIKTPKNKYFGIKLLDKVSLFSSSNTPKFQILDYNTPKTKTSLKICRISNETYAKIEVFRKKAKNKEVLDFFKNGIDKLENFGCNTKEIDIKDDLLINKKILTKKDFNFDEIIGDISKTGLYYVTFIDPNEREFNDKLNYPIFFGVINSHITMKISRNGDAFFFVNNFDGEVLENQEISINLNNFKEKNQEWNNQKSNYDISYFSPLDKGVFDKTIILGKTGKDGILKVNLNDKIEYAFDKTFVNDWEYDYEGLYNSFFITSTGLNNLSYLNSTWNSGIAPWNFGYSYNNDYYNWYSNSNVNQDAVIGDRWVQAENPYYAHIYTDRVLYLPGEEVFIKAIVRKSSDLSIPKDSKFNLKILDSAGKEILNKLVKVNEYGSLNEKISIPKTGALGNYSMYLEKDNSYIVYGGFSVEVFKNPKFKNEILLETEGLNEGLVKIDKQEIKNNDYWDETQYLGKFKIKAKVFSKYYNGNNVANAEFNYKIYKQYYYDNSYWDSCYYGCYWEPQKEFYSEGKGKLDANGFGSFETDVDFASSYSDYKYIVEVSVIDNIGDNITGSNSIIAKLPDDYKKYNNDLSINFLSQKKFIKAGDDVVIEGGLNIGKWSEFYDDKYVLIIKRKYYETREIDDVRGYKRPITTVNEKLEKIFLVNSYNFSETVDGKLKLNYKLFETGEYVFEYAKLNIQNINNYLKKEIDYKITQNVDNYNKVVDEIPILSEEGKQKNQLDLIEIKKLINEFNILGKNEFRKIEYVNREVETCIKNENNVIVSCSSKIKNIEVEKVLKLDDLLDKNTSSYFSILTYGDNIAQNPIINDNKIRVIPEKISYSLGETAKVLIRLPVSNGKILWTIEKQGVVKSEYIDVKGNVFFKEFVVDDTFIPNAYIGVVLVDTRKDVVPEYKVGYSEVVVDKTDKKSFITIKTDKKNYKPREKVTLDIKVQDKNNKAKQSELTVMVVDDSLISLMGNVDLNTLEKFYKKLPFGIQTSITNIAMLKNYYFSRPGIVGGSGFGNFKGGDSAVSSRNIFKNTAYYNPNVITDYAGNAKVTFSLPDNLTNFRVMVVSNSKDNFFGYSEEFIEVRKSVIIEDKTPLILREGDKSVIGANIFNNSGKEIGFNVELKAKDIEVTDPIKNIIIKNGESKLVSWNIFNDYNKTKVEYSISALGDSSENSDKIENIIEIKQSPILISNIIKSSDILEKNNLNINIEIPKNTNFKKSKVEVILSNNKLVGIDKIVSSLAIYPYGCIEQTISSTLPNVILKNFNKLFNGVVVNKQELEKNIASGVDRIISMQTEDGGFGYWPGDKNSNLHITPYVVRGLIDMRDSQVKLPEGLITNSIKYLENNFNNVETPLEKAEIFWALSKAGKKVNIDIDLSNIDRHTLIAYTYGLILNNNSVNKTLINSNINKIKSLLKINIDNWYWNNNSDKAIFASMLMDYNDLNNDFVDKIISELYENDWSSYYYSTQEKNNAFFVFYKYISKFGKNNISKYSFTIGKEKNVSKIFEIGGDKISINRFNYNLNNIADSQKLNINIVNLEGAKIYAQVILKQYPEDKTKIKPYSNEIKVSREIFEVLDENKLSECSNNNYYNSNKINCDKVLLKVKNDNFKKGQLYKAKILVTFDNNENRRDLVIEDYLPSSFRIINSNFKTESSNITQATNSSSWEWDHIEFKPDVVMANASYSWGNNAVFEYYFRPEFAGTYTYPPVTSYMMYNPLVRSNNEFRIIEVK